MFSSKMFVIGLEFIKCLSEYREDPDMTQMQFYLDMHHLSRPWSDYLFRSSLIWFYTVYLDLFGRWQATNVQNFRASVCFAFFNSIF